MNGPDDLRRELGGPPVLRFPRGWTHSAAWRRAQEVPAVLEPCRPTGFWVTFKETGAGTYPVVFAVLEGELVARCSCKGFRFHDRWCSHVAALWWAWSRSRVTVWDLEAPGPLEAPPVWLRLEDREAEADERRLDDLKPRARAIPSKRHGGGADAPLTNSAQSRESRVSHSASSES